MAQLNLYIDDSGSRHPDKKSDRSRLGRDWFALGGIVIRQEDEDAAKALHKKIVDDWSIRHPFHITDMLAQRKGFSWLGKLSDREHDRFWSEYKTFLGAVPAMGMACVIDRPGYVARAYLEKHGANKWLLCRSAFDILVERAVKYARLNQRKLGVIFEGDPGINDTMKGYFANLKANGLSFDGVNSGKYKPLEKDAFAGTLSTVEYKNKSSVLLQIADSYVYAMARSPYDKKFDIYRRLRDTRRISNFALPNEYIHEMGVKYYCFELHQAQSTKKPG